MHEDSRAKNDSSDLKILGAFSSKSDDDKENQNSNILTKNILKIKSFASIREPLENITKNELLKFR